MSRTATLKPAPGRRVLDPDTRKPLPEAGQPVTLNTYWQRRLRDGDVLDVTAPRAGRAKSATSPSSAPESVQ